MHSHYWGWGKWKFHDKEHFTNHAIIWEFSFNLCKISFINNMTRMIEIIEHHASQNNYEAIFYSLWAIKISNTISKPKTSPKVPWQGATMMEISPKHHTTTDKSEPKHTSMICTYLGMGSLSPALPHPHTKRFTSSPHGQQGMTHHTVPFLHMVFWPYG